jgi:hypothetical protein
VVGSYQNESERDQVEYQHSARASVAAWRVVPVCQASFPMDSRILIGRSGQIRQGNDSDWLFVLADRSE